MNSAFANKNFAFAVRLILSPKLAFITKGSGEAFGFWFVCEMFWAKIKLHLQNNLFFKIQTFRILVYRNFCVSPYSVVHRQLHWYNQGVGMCVEADQEAGICLTSFAVAENACGATMVASKD